MTFALGRRGVVAALVGLLCACTSLLAPTRIIVPADRLQAAMAGHFPIERHFAQGLDLTVAAPRVTLQPEADRIVVEADLAGAASLLQRPVTGTLALSQRLAFDADSSTVRARDVRVERLHVDGLDPALERLVERLARPLAAQLLEGQAVYVLRPRDVERMRAAGVVPGSIHITGEGVVIALVPA